MPPSLSIPALILAGFLISGVLTPDIRPPVTPVRERSPPSLPSASSETIPAAESTALQKRPSDGLALVKEVKKERVWSPALRSPLSTGEENEQGKVLALRNGTVYFLNRAGVAQWKLLVGPDLSFSWIASADDDIDYYVYPGLDGELYEYSKASGKRRHNWTVEEFVHRAPVVKGAVITTGTKTSTFFVVNANSGELLYTDKEPWPTAKKQNSEQKSVASKLESSDDNYITIVRTDYYLESFDLGKPLWSVMVSRLSAYNVGPGLTHAVDDNEEMSTMLERNIPVIFHDKIDLLTRQKPMLLPPSAQIQELIHESHGKEKIFGLSVIPCDVGSNCPPESDNSSLAPSSTTTALDKFASGCPMGNCVAAKPEFPWSNIRMPRDLEKIPNASETQVLSNYEEIKFPSTRQNSTIHAIPGVFIWMLISSLLFIVSFCYLKLRKRFKHDKQKNELEEVPSNSRRRKPRRAGQLKNSPLKNDASELFGKDNNEINGHAQANGDVVDWLMNDAKAFDDGRQVGKLFVSTNVIGRGSNGTVVFEGLYDGRPVAVKRLLRAHHDVAYKEIQNLIASDRNPNIVRWYGVEQDLDFVYVALERCICSLGDLILTCSDPSPLATKAENPTSSSLVEMTVQVKFSNGIGSDMNLWKENGLPSQQLLKLMRNVVCGLAHLHELGIIHRDLKPQNVLVSNDMYLTAKLSDMGISKRLVEDVSSLTHNATGYGSSGWQAPEQLLHGRQTRAVDLFSLGCIIFFCITKGKHPFGNYFERDSNIVNNRVDLFLVDHIPEAEHLISQLLDPDPKMRPSAVEVSNHPFFWSSEMRLSFLRDTSDRVELEDRENGSDLLTALESIGLVAFGGKWGDKLDSAFIMDMGRYRKYKFDCVRDLLRVIRNKLNHYRELSKELQETLGSVPEGFEMYFNSRFPKLLIEVYKVIRRFCKDEDAFCKYFKTSLM